MVILFYAMQIAGLASALLTPVVMALIAAALVKYLFQD